MMKKQKFEESGAGQATSKDFAPMMKKQKNWNDDSIPQHLERMHSMQCDLGPLDERM